MRLSKEFTLREVAGRHLLLPSGDAAAACTEVAFMSDSAAWLWNALQDKEFSEAEAVDLLMSEYDVDPATAQADVAAVLKKWSEKNMLYDRL